MVTPVGSAEFGSVRLDVVAAPSFVDVKVLADPEPIIDRRPELFVDDWKGDSEVVALIKEPGEVAAAGVIRYVESGHTLEAFAIGEVPEEIGADALKAALHARVEERRKHMPMPERVCATIHWGTEPPTLEVDTSSQTVGVEGYRAKAQSRKESLRRFLEDIMRPYGPLKI